MPRFVFKNMSKDHVQTLSNEMAQELATIIDCPIDWLTFEYIDNSIFLLGDDITNQSIFVEVSWFKRSQQVQDDVAQALYNYLLKQMHEKEITIIFYELSKMNYYENGQHY